MSTPTRKQLRAKRHLLSRVTRISSMVMALVIVGAGLSNITAPSAKAALTWGTQSNISLSAYATGPTYSDLQADFSDDGTKGVAMWLHASSSAILTKSFNGTTWVPAANAYGYSLTDMTPTELEVDMAGNGSVGFGLNVEGSKAIHVHMMNPATGQNILAPTKSEEYVLGDVNWGNSNVSLRPVEASTAPTVFDPKIQVSNDGSKVLVIWTQNDSAGISSVVARFGSSVYDLATRSGKITWGALTTVATDSAAPGISGAKLKMTSDASKAFVTWIAEGGESIESAVLTMNSSDSSIAVGTVTAVASSSEPDMPIKLVEFAADPTLSRLLVVWHEQRALRRNAPAINASIRSRMLSVSGTAITPDLNVSEIYGNEYHLNINRIEASLTGDFSNLGALTGTIVWAGLAISSDLGFARNTDLANTSAGDWVWCVDGTLTCAMPNRVSGRAITFDYQVSQDGSTALLMWGDSDYSETRYFTLTDGVVDQVNGRPGVYGIIDYRIVLGSSLTGDNFQAIIQDNSSNIKGSVMSDVQQISVSYNGNGAAESAPSATTLNAGVAHTMSSAILTKANSYHIGWYSNASGSSGTALAAGSAYTPTANSTVYARWMGDPSNASVLPTADPSGKAVIVWDAVSDQTGISYVVTSSPTGAICSPGMTSNEALCSGTAGVTYTFSVKSVYTNPVSGAVTNSLSTAASGSFTFQTVTPPAPGTPGTPIATAGDGSASVSWTASTGSPDSYTVTSSPGSLTCEVAAPSTSCVVTGLTNGTAYTFSVVAENVGGLSGTSPNSNSITPTSSTPTTPPSEPAGDEPGTPGTPAVTAGDGQVAVSWAASSGEVSLYLVTAHPGGNTCIVRAPATKCTISGLTNGLKYYFKVKARNSDGWSSQSPRSRWVTPEQKNTTPTPPAVTSRPSAPSASNVSVRSSNGNLVITVEFSGSASARPEGYRATVNPSGDTCFIETASGSCSIFGLKRGVEYSLSIVALNALGSSDKFTASKKYAVNGNSLLSLARSLSISGFAGDSALLTANFKNRLKAFMKQNPGVKAITCTGYTAGTPVAPGDRQLARARAKAVCGFIKTIKPEVATTILGKTPGLPWGAASRKVLLRGFESTK